MAEETRDVTLAEFEASIKERDAAIPVSRRGMRRTIVTKNGLVDKVTRRVYNKGVDRRRG